MVTEITHKLIATAAFIFSARLQMKDIQITKSSGKINFIGPTKIIRK